MSLYKKTFSDDENRSSLKEILMNIFQAKENNPNGRADVQERIKTVVNIC